MEARTLAALCVVLVAAVAFAWYHFVAGRPEAVTVTDDQGTAPPSASAAASAAPTAEPSPGSDGQDQAAPGAAAGAVVVDVAGAVADPGIYTLPAGSRVADALDAAGGSDPGTDTDGLNRARLLLDGEQILVGATAPAPAPGAGTPTGVPAAPVSLNSATPDQLQDLPGIGPVLAERIVAHRQQHGGFTSVEQLGDVSGIGERRLAELRDRVTL
ncbi:helix-hairpin-helix domain-containing protein [Streptomyces sp. NPDC049879]|uniref:helix-hairpin-helix domain-containing protein n=1 Tax=Streptomyces sp. NPDC049879 TaxID=3365598 RepID=UPI0037B0970E